MDYEIDKIPRGFFLSAFFVFFPSRSLSHSVSASAGIFFFYFTFIHTFLEYFLLGFISPRSNISSPLLYSLMFHLIWMNRTSSWSNDGWNERKKSLLEVLNERRKSSELFLWLKNEKYTHERVLLSYFSLLFRVDALCCIISSIAIIFQLQSPQKEAHK
jgi:hypothetical protein